MSDTNNQRPTPETDAFLLRIDDSEIDLDMVEAALMDMERERDEARAAAHGYRASYDGAEEACRVWKARTAEAHHEMAAWRETVLDLRGAIGRLDADLDQALAALLRLHDAADAYRADQAYAPHPHIAAVPPVEPADGVALNKALDHAAEVLGIANGGARPMWPEATSAPAVKAGKGEG